VRRIDSLHQAALSGRNFVGVLLIYQYSCPLFSGHFWTSFVTTDGDGVAQLVMASGFHLTATQQFRVRLHLPPLSLEGRQEVWQCMIK
jgi:hypothetical protein